MNTRDIPTYNYGQSREEHYKLACEAIGKIDSAITGMQELKERIDESATYIPPTEFVAISKSLEEVNEMIKSCMQLIGEGAPEDVREKMLKALNARLMEMRGGLLDYIALQRIEDSSETTRHTPANAG